LGFIARMAKGLAAEAETSIFKMARRRSDIRTI